MLNASYKLGEPLKNRIARPSPSVRKILALPLNIRDSFPPFDGQNHECRHEVFAACVTIVIKARYSLINAVNGGVITR